MDYLETELINAVIAESNLQDEMKDMEISISDRLREFEDGLRFKIENTLAIILRDYEREKTRLRTAQYRSAVEDSADYRDFQRKLAAEENRERNMMKRGILF